MSEDKGKKQENNTSKKDLSESLTQKRPEPRNAAPSSRPTTSNENSGNSSDSNSNSPQKNNSK